MDKMKNDNIIYINDTFELSLGCKAYSLSYCKVFKFTTLLDCLVYLWPVVNLLLDGLSSLNLSIFYVAMFFKVHKLSLVDLDELAKPKQKEYTQ